MLYLSLGLLGRSLCCRLSRLGVSGGGLLSRRKLLVRGDLGPVVLPLVRNLKDASLFCQFTAPRCQLTLSSSLTTDLVGWAPTLSQ